MENCKYHPDVAGRWYCPQCDACVCDKCAEINAAKNLARCFVCGNDLDGLRSDQYVPPFWRALGEIHRYPLNSVTLTVLASLAAVTGILTLFPMGYFFALTLNLLLFAYAAMIMEHTAHGNLKHPQVFLLFESSGKAIIFRQFVLVVAMALAATWMGRHFGRTAFFVCVQTFTFLFPAGIMAAVIEDSLLACLNPRRLLAIIRAIGWPYLLLLLFLYLLQIGNATLTQWVGGASVATLLLQVVIGGYFLIVIYHLLGYVIYQYHDKLGFAAHQGGNLRTHNTGHIAQSWSNMLNKARVLIMEGRPDEGKAVAKEAALAFPTNLQVQAFIYDLLRKSGSDEERLQIGIPYLNVLLYQNQLNKAAEVYATISRIDKEIKPADGDKVALLAAVLHQAGRNREALRLISDFHAYYPDHSDIAKNYFYAVDILIKMKQSPEIIKSILDFLADNLPDPQIQERVKHYRLRLKPAALGAGGA